jgi:hypothetical protein
MLKRKTMMMTSNELDAANKKRKRSLHSKR